MTEKFGLSIALSHCHFLSTEDKNILLEKIKDLDEFLLLSIYDISVIVGKSINYKGWKPKKLYKDVKNSIRLMERYSIEMIVNTENDFPQSLIDIPNRPFAIYFRGALQKNYNALVAMVGTRRPTGAGIKAAMRISSEFAERDVCVASGLALGIDSFAHKGVVSNRGKTIAVLACGVENIYPRTNSRLAGRILETGGSVISEYAPGLPALKYRFPERNRIISGLSNSVLVVEAPEKSGALITADYAKKQHKPVYVCAELLSSIQNKGCKKLYDNGAKAIKNADEILNDKNVNMQKELFGEE
ncbi:MAG: DNA-protecting protein DprA [Treponema sp.]|nr:MAG: DNA-protecting protein DprA [Treponema sp.]